LVPEQFRDEFYSDIKKTIETTAYTNVNLLNLYTRVLCILIATTDFDGQAALIKNGLIDLLYKVLGGPAGGTSSVTSAIDCLEAVFLIEKHLRTSHKDFLKNFRSKCDQAKTQYRYNSYAFYFDLFQSGLQDSTLSCIEIPSCVERNADFFASLRSAWSQAKYIHFHGPQ
jgi:hypothetical protein